MSIEAIANEANRQVQEIPVTSVPPEAKAFLGSKNLSDHGVQAFAGHTLASIAITQAKVDEFNDLIKAILNPFDSSAEGIQVPGQLDGTKLYHNRTSETLTVPAGADRAVIVMDAIGSARNGEVSATIYFVDSTKVSRSSPQNIKDGCVIASRKISTGLNLQLFDICDLYSAGISAGDLSSQEFIKGSSAAMHYIGRDTWAAQMYPGKIGQLVSDDRNCILNVPKSERVTAIARNPAALYGTPFRQGFNQKDATYANAIQGASTYAAVPRYSGMNAGADAVECYSGADNFDNFSVLAADAQMSQMMRTRLQTFTIGTPPTIPIIPAYPPQACPKIQVMSTDDMPSLFATIGGNSAMFPKDCNAITLNGTIELTGPLSTLPYVNGKTRAQTGQGIVIPPYAQQVPHNGTNIAGDYMPYASGSWDTALSSSGSYINASSETAGYNNVWWTGIEQPVGGWEVHVDVLSGTFTNAAGEVEDRVVGTTSVYGAMGTKNNVFYSAVPVLANGGQTTGKNGNDQSVSMNGNPIVTSESLGSIVLDNIIVRPGMGMADSQFSRGEPITGCRVWMQAVDKPTSQGGVPRPLPCLTDGSGGVASVSIIHPGEGMTSVPYLYFTPSPVPGGTAQGYCVMSTEMPTPGGVVEVVVTYPGFGYTTPPTIDVSNGGGTTPAQMTANLKGAPTTTRYNSQQFGISLTNVNGELIKYDEDASDTSQQHIIIMDGLIPTGEAASTVIEVELNHYTVARLKSNKAPIRTMTERTHVAQNPVMAQALAEIAKYAPQLYANPLALDVAQAIFFSLGGANAALHAASTGHSAPLWNIGKRMFGAAKQAYNSVRNAIQSLDPSTKAALSTLVTGPEAQMALQKMKKLVGLDSIPDPVIMRGVEVANKHLAQLFSASDAIGAGFFDDVSKGIAIAGQGIGLAKQVGLLARSDSGLHSRTDAPLGAGFWGTLGKVAGTALPLLLDDGSYPRSRRGLYAADETSFPVLNSDGSAAGTLDLLTTDYPIPLRKYVTQSSSAGNVHIDSRLESVKSGDSQNVFEFAKQWMKDRPHIPDLYITVKQHLTNTLMGRSWEAALAANLAGSNDLITGKISHVDSNGVAHIGPIVGASEKSRIPGLIVPKANAKEAPGNKFVSAIKA